MRRTYGLMYTFWRRCLFAAHRAQADANEIEAGAQRRMADEYDKVQPDDAAIRGRPKSVPDENAFSAASVGLTLKQIHEARAVREAEKNNPCVVRSATDRLRPSHAWLPQKTFLVSPRD